MIISLIIYRCYNMLPYKCSWILTKAWSIYAWNFHTSSKFTRKNWNYQSPRFKSRRWKMWRNCKNYTRLCWIRFSIIFMSNFIISILRSDFWGQIEACFKIDSAIWIQIWNWNCPTNPIIMGKNWRTSRSQAKIAICGNYAKY